MKSPRYEFYDGGRRKAFIICGLRSDPRYPRYQAEPRQEEATANNGRGERSWMEKTEREREREILTVRGERAGRDLSSGGYGGAERGRRENNKTKRGGGEKERGKEKIDTGGGVITDCSP